MGLAAALAAKGITNAEADELKGWLSTGLPNLDQRISGKYVGGGIPQGRITELAGPESAGKTAIASNVMAEAQKAGGVAIFMDHEKSFKIGFAKEVFGMTDDPDHWSYHRPLTYEESWDKVKEILYILRGVEVQKNGKLKLNTPMVPYDIPVVVVFDSLASMTPQEKFMKDAEDATMRDRLALAAATSATFDVMASIAELTNTTMLFLNQLREQPGVTHGDNTTTPGGKAPAFYCSVRIKLARSILYDKIAKVKYGQEIRAEVYKNKVWKPFGKTGWNFLFDDGSGTGRGKFDIINSVIDELIDIGKIERSGAWITWDGKKWNSRDALEKHIVANDQYPMLIALFPADSED
jgi:RecA/RadA recombinase